MAAPIYKGGRPFFKPGIRLGNNVVEFTGTGTPTNGTSGTGVGFAGPGSSFMSTNGTRYVNQGTKASPFWVPSGQQLMNTYSADGAITLVSQVALLTKGSAAAMTVAAPGAAGVGARITIVSGSNFAHVITFTGTTLGDGTTGLNLTVTMTAFIGSALTVIGNTATQWVVESQNNLTSIA